MLPAPTALSIAKIAAACALLVLPSRAQSVQSFEVADLLHGGAAAGDSFGVSVALSGQRALVGAFRAASSGVPGTGSAFVFERQLDGTWTEIAKLTASDAASGDEFGRVVALDWDRALVGARGHDTSAGGNAGSAYVFERQGDGTWLEVAKLTASDGAASDMFGYSVSLDGDRALVGAWYHLQHADPAIGTVYVFERQGDATWSEAAKIVKTMGDSNMVGATVSLSGERALLGSYINLAAYVYERQGDGTWIEVAKLKASDGLTDDEFGWSVALDGERAVVVSALGDTPAGTGTGAVHVFERDATGTWVEVVKLVGSDTATGDGFGSSVELSGDWLAVGAMFDDTAQLGNCGSVYVFRRQTDGSWDQVSKLEPAHAESFDFFGRSVAIANQRVLVGAYAHDTTAGPNAGAATVFRFCEGCAKSFGQGSAGCAGTQTLSASVAPETGTAGFTITCDNAPPSSVGFLGLGDAGTIAGFDPLGLGVLVHVDLLASSFLMLLPMPSDAAGLGTKAIAIPPSPALAGAAIVAQVLWTWTSCSLPPFGFSSSRGLALTILAP